MSKKLKHIVFLSALLWFLLAQAGLAQTSGEITTDSLLRQIESLQNQLLSLQSQLNSLSATESGGELLVPDGGQTTGGQTTPTTQLPSGCLDLKRDLYSGLRGEDVKALQKFLKQQGFWNTISFFGVSLDPTGYFGPATAKGVAKFQEANGIAGRGYGNGYVGFATRGKIKDLTCGTTQPPVQPPIPPTALSVDLKANGSDGPLTLASGQNLNLTWTTSGTNQCELGAPINSGGDGYGGSSGTITPGHPFYPSASGTTYNITCYDTRSLGQKVSDSVTVSTGVTDRPAVPSTTVNFTASPVVVSSGQSSTLSWSSTGATSCSASGGWSGARAISGNESVAPTQSTTYTLTCTGPGGSASQNATVSVGQTSNTPTLTLIADPSSIQTGQGATLSWSSTGATSCSASGGWSGTKVLSGVAFVTPSQTTTYNLTCTGSGGSNLKSVTVSVGTALPPPPSPLPPTVNLKANGSDGPVGVIYGGSVTLSWASSNAVSCTAVSGNPYDLWYNQTLGPSGSKVIAGLVQANTYSISCRNSSGQIASDSVTVSVGGTIAPAVSADIKANGSDGTITLGSGQSLEIAWSAPGASGCTISPNVFSPTPLAGSTVGVSATGAVAMSPGGIGYPTRSQAYVLQCSFGSQSVSDSVIVNLAGDKELLRRSALSGLAAILSTIQEIISNLRFLNP